MNEKITQIIPADDWVAVFKIEDETELSLPLNCWALCQAEDGSSRIEGIYVDASGTCSAAKLAENFIRYKRHSAAGN